MTTEPAVDARATARAMIERALTPNKAQGQASSPPLTPSKAGCTATGPTLTPDDLADIRAWLTTHVDPIYELLAPRAPDRVWSDTNDA